MGRLLEDRGSPNEALLCFQEASTADRSSAEALCCRGGNLLRRGDLDGAAFFFEGVSTLFLALEWDGVLILRSQVCVCPLVASAGMCVVGARRKGAGF